MASFEERIYDLGSAALADQERQVSELRSRGVPLLAAGAVIAGLLAKGVFHKGHPTGWLEITATTSGLIGAAGLLVSVVLLLRTYELGFSVKAAATYRSLFDQQILEQPMVDLALADAFDVRRAENVPVVRRLGLFLGLALTSLVLETAGLALAAALTS
jgi:hypothetical protein